MERCCTTLQARLGAENAELRHMAKRAAARANRGLSVLQISEEIRAKKADIAGVKETIRAHRAEAHQEAP